ncbi:hypothetical protein RDV64_03260 [Acuticoccus sp. MNP-M23]|uniref:hypothetical protein n=1 Tax=Acuticoccus sp. MNP-M23 TaxID=3072793 RepID=UPI002815BFEA|nr:hypothetical protein [Acuticoccus sp. MNP-M23]WMS43436.1 hypothetical protein RDV64_03260 [Acuticoccus sp. MNP-M23]
MIPIILGEVETAPAAYPNTDGDVAWQRIEAYVAHRWTVREVVWVVEGPGEWLPRLSPATIDTAEEWEGNAYQPVSMASGRLGGLILPRCATWRFTADVGAGPCPDAVLEAHARLVAYLADTDDRAGVTAYEADMAGAIRESYQRPAAWIAKALQNSGAADLLRPYRRANHALALA